MLYHYTTARAAGDIRRAGILRARPVLVHADLADPLLGREPAELRPPVVWLTINPILDLTVVVREAVSGLSLERDGDFWRFGVADETAPLSLPEWAEKHGHAPELFRWMVLTGELAGSDYTTWRLCERDIPRAEWLAVETWQAGQWRPAGETE